jgi:hypothetical protein
VVHLSLEERQKLFHLLKRYEQGAAEGMAYWGVGKRGSEHTDVIGILLTPGNGQYSTQLESRRALEMERDSKMVDS